MSHNSHFAPLFSSPFFECLFSLNRVWCYLTWCRGMGCHVTWCHGMRCSFFWCLRTTCYSFWCLTTTTTISSGSLDLSSFLLSGALLYCIALHYFTLHYIHLIYITSTSTSTTTQNMRKMKITPVTKIPTFCQKWCVRTHQPHTSLFHTLTHPHPTKSLSCT